MCFLLEQAQSNGMFAQMGLAPGSYHGQPDIADIPGGRAT